MDEEKRTPRLGSQGTPTEGPTEAALEGFLYFNWWEYISESGL